MSFDGRTCGRWTVECCCGHWSGGEDNQSVVQCANCQRTWMRPLLADDTTVADADETGGPKCSAQ